MRRSFSRPSFLTRFSYYSKIIIDLCICVVVVARSRISRHGHFTFVSTSDNMVTAETKSAAYGSQHEPLRIFVTVGTTRFDSLIRAVVSPNFLDAVANLSSRSSLSPSPSPSPSPIPGRSSSKAHVVVQYGNSSIAEILTTSALASIDPGSQLVPEPGLRIINGRRVYQNSPNIPALDPGLTGTIAGLRLRRTAQPRESSASTSALAPTPTEEDDARRMGEGMFDSLLREAKAMHGITDSIVDSAMQGATLEAETEQGVELQLFQFAPDLKSYISSAHVVISHAGSGTILDTLRMQPKVPTLVVVPNTSLMDNHQVELAEALARDNHLVAGSEQTLAEDVARALQTKCEPFPDFDPSRFIRIMDAAMQL